MNGQRSIATAVLLALVLAICGIGQLAAGLPARSRPATPHVDDGQPQSAPTQPPLTSFTSFNLGIPAGDAYSPASLAVDAEHQLAYVLNVQTSAGGGALSVVDVRERNVLRQVPLEPFRRYMDSGKFVVAPAGRQAYLLNSTTRRLYSYDLEMDGLEPRLDGVLDVLFNPDGRLLLVVSERQLAAWTADLEERLWQIDTAWIHAIAGNGRYVLVHQGNSPDLLTLHSVETGEQLAGLAGEEYMDQIVAGPGDTWAVRVSGRGASFLQLLDARLGRIAEVEVPGGQGLFYDAPRRRFLVSGGRYAADDHGGEWRPLLRALDADDLSPLLEQAWPYGQEPDVLAADGEHGLLGLHRWSTAHLSYVDPRSLLPTARAVLGVRVTDMLLDEGHARLFVADNQDRVHVLGLPDGERQAVWSGGPPMSLDVRRNILYVNQAAGAVQAVTALDSASGERLVRFPQPGVPAPDTRHGLVYIARAGVTVYDNNGRRLGRLESTFPSPTGFSPNPYAFAATVSPISGTLVVYMNNGVPGSNNRNYLLLYPPAEDGMPVDEPIQAPAPDALYAPVATDPDRGDIYVAYSSFRGYSSLQRLDAQGQVVDRLGGRAGYLAYDAAARVLYVAAPGALARFDEHLALQGLYLGPENPTKLAVNPAAGQLYYLPDTDSRVTVQALDELTPFRPGPRETVSGLPTERIDEIRATVGADGGTVLFATVRGNIYRSTDRGQSWTRLALISLGDPAYSNLTVAAPGVLYHSHYTPLGADGVLRSDDWGETWTNLAEGLTDLRSKQPVLAAGADQVYVLTPQEELLAWNGEASETKRWEVVFSSQLYDGLSPLLLAPDGTLFSNRYRQFRRSQDGGRTWEELPSPEGDLDILGFSPDYGRDHTVYGLNSRDVSRFVRSQDGGQSWSAPRPGLVLAHDYAPSYLHIRQGALILFRTDYDGNARLFRSRNRGETWEQLASPQDIQGALVMDVGPDGTYWFGGPAGGVTGVDPETLAWEPVVAPVQGAGGP